MFRRSVEWFLGSVVVYILTAACAATGGIDDMIEMATGGLAAMVGGNQGSGAEGSDGRGAESSGAQASDGSGADNSDGEGATGGVSIIDPVPDADAAEDGTRIVNLYRTTADGLKTSEGYWDTQLDLKCSFMPAEDGIERCLPASLTLIQSFFGDDACAVPVAYTSKGACPSHGYVPQQTSACTTNGTANRIAVYSLDSEVTTGIHQKSGENCVALPEATYASFSFFAVGGKLEASEFAEGTLVQGGQ